VNVILRGSVASKLTGPELATVSAILKLFSRQPPPPKLTVSGKVTVPRDLEMPTAVQSADRT
jgi:hypothetical protein